MNRDPVAGFFEADAVVTHAKAEKTFELARERLDGSRSGFRVAMDRFENGHGDVLGDGWDLRWVRESFSLLLWRTIATDLLHREAEICDYLFEGDACASMAEVFTRGVQGAAIFIGELLVIVVINHDFKQRTDRAELGRGKLIEQGVSLLEFVLDIKCHEVCSLISSYTGGGVGGKRGTRSRRHGSGSMNRCLSRGWIWRGGRGGWPGG